MPQSAEGSCRKDGIDAWKIAQTLGYSVFSDMQGFGKKQKLPYMGLFTLGKLTLGEVENIYAFC